MQWRFQKHFLGVASGGHSEFYGGIPNKKSITEFNIIDFDKSISNNNSSSNSNMMYTDIL